VRWAVAACLLLLPGCLHPAASPPAPLAYAPPPAYHLTLRFVRERVDGAPLPDAEAYLVPRDEASPDPARLPPPRFADDRGLVSVVYPQPVTLLVEAFGPGSKGGGWTREGMTVQVGDHVTSDRGRVEGRTVTLPLLRAERPFALNTTWGPATATPAANGTIVPAQTRVEVPLAEPYASRLASARLTVAWTQQPQQFGDLYAGLARGGGPVAKGTDNFQPPVPGTKESESVDAAPQGTGPLQAVVLTNSFVQGTLAIQLAGTLRFSGDWPRELPLPSCFAMEACLPSPLPPLPPA
jgi:hypothetical protein